MVPHNAWSAVKVYGKGKWMRTDLLYSVRVKLKVKYRASHSSGESGRERIRRRKKLGNNRLVELRENLVLDGEGTGGEH